MKVREPVIADGKTEARPVTVGLANDQQTEILSGLEEDEVVVVPGTSTRTPNTGFGGPGGGPDARGSG